MYSDDKNDIDDIDVQINDGIRMKTRREEKDIDCVKSIDLFKASVKFFSFLDIISNFAVLSNRLLFGDELSVIIIAGCMLIPYLSIYHIVTVFMNKKKNENSNINSMNMCLTVLSTLFFGLIECCYYSSKMERLKCRIGMF